MTPPQAAAAVPGLEVVGGPRAEEIEVEVRVHVHAARDHHQAARVDLLLPCREARVDGGDLPSAYSQVRDLRVGRRGDETVSDHQIVGHAWIPAFGRKRFLAIMPCTP